MNIKINGVVFKIKERDSYVLLTVSYIEYMDGGAKNSQFVTAQIISAAREQEILKNKYPTDALSTMHPYEQEDAFVIELNLAGPEEVISFLEKARFEVDKNVVVIDQQSAK